ncbi:MAG: hypothetical protein CM15mP120_29340 [Pseudomonadota bacterium]|nr:MAG: hypothetical protein CM15mP120_29340 [Pseudomonadota bacterium]
MTDKLPGRLGNPEETLVSDPRTDPRIARTMAMLGELAPGVTQIDTNASYEEALTTVLLLKKQRRCHTRWIGRPCPTFRVLSVAKL